MLYGLQVEPVPGQVPDAVAWARYAHQGAAVLYGPAHPHTIAAAQTLVLLLSHHDLPADADAVTLCRHLVEILLEAGDIDAHLSARMELAGQLHRAGHCDEAIREATTVWRQWATRHDTTDTASVLMMSQLGHMLLTCGRIGDAIAVVSEARLDWAALDDRARDTYDRFLATLAIAQHSRHTRQWHTPDDPPP